MASDRVVIDPSAMRRYVRRSRMNTVDMQSRRLALRLQTDALSACDLGTFGANRGELDEICAAIDDAARRNGEIDDFVSDTTRRAEAADRVFGVLPGWAPVMILGPMWLVYKGLVESWRTIKVRVRREPSVAPAYVPPALDPDGTALIDRLMAGAAAGDSRASGYPGDLVERLLEGVKGAEQPGMPQKYQDRMPKLGTYIDFDGCYGCQCVDLVKHVRQDDSAAYSGNAWQYANHTNARPLGDDETPLVGSILVWPKSPPGMPHGHVAIVVGVDEENRKVRVLEQNADGKASATTKGSPVEYRDVTLSPTMHYIPPESS